MNIFVLNNCPKISAEMLYFDNKKRGIKMILESCQLLCNALHFYNIENVPYKITHFNHPASIFTRYSRNGFLWVQDHAQELIKLYYQECKKIHKCATILDFCIKSEPKIKFLQENFQNFVNCARNVRLGLDFTNILNVHIAYQEYLKARKYLSS